MTSLTGTGDDRHLVANQPVIALIFQILPPLCVSRVKVFDDLEPVLQIALTRGLLFWSSHLIVKGKHVVLRLGKDSRSASLNPRV